jgi:hypothetical protein
MFCGQITFTQYPEAVSYLTKITIIHHLKYLMIIHIQDSKLLHIIDDTGMVGAISIYPIT